jgi:uncharacterized protein (TIGR02996 family)
MLQAICREPADPLAWLALADALEETGREAEAELTRLREQLRSLEPDDARRPPLQDRMQQLLVRGVMPVMPSCTRQTPHGVPVTFHLLPPGRFRMGCPPEEPHRQAADPAVRWETIEHPFWIGRTLLTQAQTDKKDSDHPTTLVWDARLLGQWSDAWDCLLRWPTEVEWEYACRAATTTRYHGGDAECVPLVSWCRYGEAHRTHPTTQPVARLVPNAWGLYDMHGNLWEWLAPSDRTDGHLTAGGCFRAIPQRCTATARMVSRDNPLKDIIGGRLAFDWKPTCPVSES